MILGKALSIITLEDIYVLNILTNEIQYHKKEWMKDEDHWFMKI